MDDDSNKATATKDIVEEYKEGNEDNSKAAPTKDIVEEYQEGNEEENEDNTKATATKDIEEEYKEGNEKIEEALKNSDTEDVDSNLGSPLSDGKYYLEPFCVNCHLLYVLSLIQNEN